jgi:serine/threonine-protein kinase
MGVVYRAQDPVIGRAVAVKTIRLDAQSAGMSQEDLLHRFQTEARAAGRLTHPNIVVVYDAGEDDGLFYITMELVEGRSLQELLDRREALPLSRVLRIMQQACSALDFAHQHNVVHRDIKPANLMLTPDDTLKITDFGTAKILKYGTVQTAQVIGTPSYMSPEQIKGRPVDGRSDVFSLGVVLYELVTGEKPFPGDSVTTVIYKIVNEEPIPPRELDSAIPPGISAVITRALAKAPIARFHTCREFLEALQNYRDFQAPAPAPLRAPSPAKAPVSRPGAAANSSGALSTGQRSPLSAQAPPQKQTGSAWVALVLVAIIAGAGYRVWPAVQEIWQRSQAPRATNAVAETGSQPDAASADVPATPPVSAADPADRASAEGATPLESVPAKLASQPASAQPAVARPMAAGSVRAQSQADEPLAPAVAAAPEPEIALPPRASASQRSSPSYKPPSDVPQTDSSVAQAKQDKPQQETSRLMPTPAATRMQRLIEAALVQAGANEKIQVTAVGNSVTLTGKLTPRAHSKLVTWLQNTPTRVQIIDDIEYAEEPAPSASGGDAVPF